MSIAPRRHRTGLVLALLGLVAVWFLATDGGHDAGRALGRWITGSAPDQEGTFWCPMDPQIVRSRPGTCPICNMELVVFEGGGEHPADGVLQLTDRQVQQAGVRIGTAEVRDLVREIDTAGQLTVDPHRCNAVAVRFPGQSRIEELHVRSAGERVREGQPVANVACPKATELLATYRTALENYTLLREEDPAGEDAALALDQVNAIKARFQEFGLPGALVNIYVAKPKYMFGAPVFPILAPADGVVLEEPTVQVGSHVQEGKVLFTIADLGELWVDVDLFESEIPLVTLGQRLEFWTDAVPDRRFQTRVRIIEPLMQSRSQTMRARCKATNADGRLAPGMSVRVRILSAAPGTFSVPESAVLQSGRRDVVIVSDGAGRFRPRIVEVGRRYLSASVRAGGEGSFGGGDERFHEILGGLEQGDRVVVAGNFLLNAEAQFQGVLKKMFDADEASRSSPALGPAAAEAVDSVLEAYLAIAKDLAQDRTEALPERARALAAAARAELPNELAPGFGRMAGAAESLARSAEGGADALEETRTHFGSLSREVVAYLRDFAPARVSEGQLFLFQCPMADDYGFDLWVQDDGNLANPYMGQAMPECGRPASLR